MSNLPVPIGGAGVPNDARTDALRAALDSANAYMAADLAPATLRAYAARWAAFEAWCRRHGLSALPATDATLAAYLAGLADAKLSAATVDQHAAAVAWGHRRADLPPPNASARVKRVQRGIRRTIGSASQGKAPVTAEVTGRSAPWR